MRPRLTIALAATVGSVACSAPDSVAPAGSAARSGTLSASSATAAVGPGCSFERWRGTMRLVADCTTDRTIRIPDGVTLDGAGHTITVVDPAGGHFRGAVVENDGPRASVHGLRIVAAALADVCDEGDDRLAGIRLTDASGVVSGNAIAGLAQHRADGEVSGCQEGWSIWVRTRSAGGSPVDVAISRNEIEGYQKEGILVHGAVAATVDGNELRGGGPQRAQAQYGIEVTTSVPGTITRNRVSGNVYLGGYPAYAGGINSDGSRRLTVRDNIVTGSSAGIQLFAAEDADIVGNTVVGPAAGSCPAWAAAGPCSFGVQVGGTGSVHGNRFSTLDVGVDVLAGSGSVRISGNRMHDVGTPVRRE